MSGCWWSNEFPSVSCFDRLGLKVDVSVFGSGVTLGTIAEFHERVGSWIT